MTLSVRTWEQLAVLGALRKVLPPPEQLVQGAGGLWGGVGIHRLGCQVGCGQAWQLGG